MVLNSDTERRDGLKTLLRQIDRNAGFNDAKDWRQAHQILRQQSFDLVAVDWSAIPRLADLHSLCAACSPTPVAILTDDASPTSTRALFDAGVIGVVPRHERAHLIVRALEMVLLGGYYVPPGALDLAVRSAPGASGRLEELVAQLPRKRRPTCPPLSPRQAQIMRFVHMGSTNKMIARTLGISEGTVKIHLASIFQQLGATNRAAAVAIYNGWLPPHLEVLLSARDSSPKPVHGETCPVPLRTATSRRRYHRSSSANPPTTTSRWQPNRPPASNRSVSCRRNPRGLHSHFPRPTSNMKNMGFFYTPLPFGVAIGGWIAAAGLLMLALWRRPFGRLHDGTLQHVWLALITALTVLWASNAWLDDGLVMHLLGATLLVTLFDWTLALVAMAAVTGIAAIVFDAAWPGIGLTYLVYGVLPVAVSALLQRAAIAWLPHNLATFIAGQGVVSPILAIGAVSGAAAGVQIAMAGGTLEVVPAGYGIETLLLAVGEAWFTGMATALIAVYRPAWVTTSDVRRYRLGGPRT